MGRTDAATAGRSTVVFLLCSSSVMSRARGRPSETEIDRTHPFQVELDRLHVETEVRILVANWMDYRVPQGDGDRRQPADRSKKRFAFRTREQAAAFQAQFGGTLHEIEDRRWR